MKISYNWLQMYFKKKLPKPEKVAEVLTMHSLEVESLDSPDEVRLRRTKSDFVFDIAVTPNRAHDCLSHYGVAKELAAAIGISNFKFLISKKIPIFKISKSVNLKVENQNLCRRAMKRVVEGVKIGESPKWLKERMISIGQKPINNIVDVTNFVTFELGQPVHAFDFDKLFGGQNQKNIIIKNASEKEKITTLDDKEYELDKDTIVISDTQKALDIAGIKGGKNSGIEKNTKNIVLSVCNFNPFNIRETSKKLGLVTDASIRFGGEITPELAGAAMDRLTEIILKIAGGKAGPIIDFYPRRPGKYVLGIHPRDVEKNLGMHIPEKEIIDILKRLGFSAKGGFALGGEIKKIKPLTNILKLAKSLVGRPYKYGASVSYDAPNFFDCSSFTSYVFSQSGAQIPRVSIDQFLFGKEINEKELKPGDLIFSKGKSPHFKKSVSNGVGHVGIYLGKNKIIHASGPWDKGKVVIEDYRKAPGFKELRGFRRLISENDDLLVLSVPSERLDVRIKEDLIEEIARIYGYEKIPSKLPEEILIPPKRNDNWFFAEAVRNILAGAGFSEVYNYSFADKGDMEVANPIAKDKKYLRTNLLDGLNANIRENSRYFKDVKIFEIGKIFPSGGETISLAGAGLKIDFYEIKGVVEMILEKLGLSDYYFADHPDKTADIRAGNASIGHIDHNAFEINFEMLVKMVEEEMEYRPISRFPAAQRDIAIFVPLNAKVIEVLDVIENTAGPLLIDTDLFDIYENEERKSFAFHLIFQSDKKTLSEKEINDLMEKIFKAIESNPQWEVRK